NTPESSIPILNNPDPRTLHGKVSFVHLAQQGKGHGKALFNSVVNDPKVKGNYDRLETVSFDPPGCGLSQTAFWKRNGFQRTAGRQASRARVPTSGKLD